MTFFNTPSSNARILMERRGFLGQTITGLGSIALGSILAEEGLLAGDANTTTDSQPKFSAQTPHFKPRAKRVLMIFASGACSPLDTWDYKPELIKHHGKPMPGNEKLVTFQGDNGNLTKSPYTFRPYGECGKMVSDLVPKIGEMSDDICFIHSLTSKTNTHGPGENFMSTGNNLDGFPSMGSWAVYALGSENDNLPAYVSIPDSRGYPQAAGNNWGNGFLPAVFQGTNFNTTNPIRNLARPSSISEMTDKATRGYLDKLNAMHLERFPGDTELAARIASYELAARMQLTVPEVADISTETRQTLAMYGADDAKNPIKASFARNCILGRRLIEKGVRFVQVFNGAYAMGEGIGNWDGHKALKKQYDKHGPVMDQPVAALLKDMKQRGLLDDTLIVWCTEFGRMPTFQKGASGRDHNPAGFTCWLAGAGVKKGYSYGATDEFGYKAAVNVSTVYDFHATILHLLGLDHERLTYYHNGLERRLTDVHGHVIHDILS